MISIKNLSKRYGDKEVVSKVTLDIGAAKQHRKPAQTQLLRQ